MDRKFSRGMAGRTEVCVCGSLQTAKKGKKIHNEYYPRILNRIKTEIKENFQEEYTNGSNSVPPSTEALAGDF